MTRDQAVAIMQNLPLIEAFAQGKPIGIPINGRVHPSHTICLTNFRSDRPLLYVVIEDPYEFQH